MRLAAAAAVCLLIALSGCNRAERGENAAASTNAAPQTPPVGFQHEPGFDAQGFYRPDQVVSAGAVKLASITIGAPSDFEAWEGGKREEVFGPVMVVFEDPASPLDEAGKPTIRVEVKPDAYLLTPGRLAFQGKDAKLGEVDYDGAFDTAALAGARSGGAEGRPVLNGELTVGGHKTALKFSYQAGD